MPYYPLKELFPGQRVQVAVGRQRQQRQSVPAQVIAEEEAKKEQEIVEPAPEQAIVTTQEKPAIPEEPRAGSRQVTVASLSPEQKADYDKIVEEEAKVLPPMAAKVEETKARIAELQRVMDENQQMEKDADPVKIAKYETAYYEHERLQSALPQLQNQYDAAARAYGEKRVAAAGITRADTGQTPSEISEAQTQTLTLAKGGREAFDYSVKKGLIKDKDAIYVDMGNGRWGYTTKDQQQKQINELVVAGVLTTDDLKGLDLTTDLRAKLQTAVDKYNAKITAENEKATNEQKQAYASQLRTIPVAGNELADLYLKGVNEGNLADFENALEEYNREQGRQVASDASKRATWEKETATQLKAEAPDLLLVFQQAQKTGDWDTYNKAVENYNQAVEYRNKETVQRIEAENRDTAIRNKQSSEDVARQIRQINGVKSVKEVWRILTPWQEDLGETFVQYMKGWPNRVKNTYANMFKPQKELTQPELKQMYEVQQESRKLLMGKDTPAWAKGIFLLAGVTDTSVIYDKKSGKYSPVVTFVAPLIGGKVTTLARPNWKLVQNAVKGAERRAVSLQLAETAIKRAEFFPEVKVSGKGLKSTYKGIADIKVDTSPSGLSKASAQRAAVNAYQKQLTRTYLRKHPEVVKKWIKEGQLTLPQAKAIAIVAVLGRVQVKPIQTTKTQLVLGVRSSIIPSGVYDTNYREKIYRRPDVRDFSAPLEDVRSRPLTKISAFPSAVTVVKPVTKTASAISLKSSNTTQLRSGITSQTGEGVRVKGKISESVAEKAKIESAPQPLPVTKAKVITQTKTALRTQTRTTKPNKGQSQRKQRRLPLAIKFPDMTDKEKRKAIKESGGAFTWRQGELAGKPVHHVVVNPFRQQDKTVVLGKTPEGAVNVTGIGQAKRSLRLTKGLAPKKSTRYEGGAVDPIVSPSGKRKVAIRFVPDRSVMRRTNIKQTKPPRFAFRSKKVGRVYRTKIGRGIVLSRQPVGRRR